MFPVARSRAEPLEGRPVLNPLSKLLVASSQKGVIVMRDPLRVANTTADGIDSCQEKNEAEH